MGEEARTPRESQVEKDLSSSWTCQRSNSDHNYKTVLTEPVPIISGASNSLKPIIQEFLFLPKKNFFSFSFFFVRLSQEKSNIKDVTAEIDQEDSRLRLTLDPSSSVISQFAGVTPVDRPGSPTSPSLSCITRLHPEFGGSPRGVISSTTRSTTPIQVTHFGSGLPQF